MKGKRVLVTGASGFIGSHLTEALVQAGAEVTALVHYNSSQFVGNLDRLSRDQRAAIRIVFGDIADSEQMLRIIEGNEIVFHLAALIAIPYSYQAPRSYVRANIEGTVNVLEAVRRTGTARLVHTSTSECYGSAVYTPIDEKHPFQGQSPYSASKIGADRMVEAYVRSFEVPAVTVRPFNTYGPRQSPRAFIPAVIQQALAGGPVRLGALEPIRDLTFVTDTAAGFIAAALAPGVVGEEFNLGVSEGWSVGDVSRRILDLIGGGIEIEHDPSRLRPKGSEVDRLISDNTRMRKATGWAPKVSLNAGLQATIDYFRAQTPPEDASLYIV